MPVRLCACAPACLRACAPESLRACVSLPFPHSVPSPSLPSRMYAHLCERICDGSPVVMEEGHALSFQRVMIEHAHAAIDAAVSAVTDTAAAAMRALPLQRAMGSQTKAGAGDGRTAPPPQDSPAGQETAGAKTSTLSGDGASYAGAAHGIQVRVDPPDGADPAAGADVPLREGASAGSRRTRVSWASVARGPASSSSTAAASGSGSAAAAATAVSAGERGAAKQEVGRGGVPAWSSQDAAAGEGHEGVDGPAQLLSLEDAEATRRRHLVGVVVFLGELFKRRVVQGAWNGRGDPPLAFIHLAPERCRKDPPSAFVLLTLSLIHPSFGSLWCWQRACCTAASRRRCRGRWRTRCTQAGARGRGASRRRKWTQVRVPSACPASPSTHSPARSGGTSLHEWHSSKPPAP